MAQPVPGARGPAADAIEAESKAGKKRSPNIVSCPVPSVLPFETMSKPGKAPPIDHAVIEPLASVVMRQLSQLTVYGPEVIVPPASVVVVPHVLLSSPIVATRKSV